MKHLFAKFSPGFFVFLLTLFGVFFRFYNLSWGAPYYFHPDERNIASAVSQMVFPTQMNPHFFAYGGLPLYVIFFSGVLVNLFTFFLCHLPFGIQLPFSSCHFSHFVFRISFEDAILMSRFYSAIFSVLLIPLLYWLGTLLKGKRTGLVASFLCLTSVGFIQFAHFGTFEMWLTLWSVLLFYLCIRLMVAHKASSYPWLLGVIMGGALATKVSHVVLIPLPLFALGWKLFHYHTERPISRRLFIFLRECLTFTAVCLLVYFLTNPFVVMDFGSFMNSMRYESSVGLGTLPVFYTGEFFTSLPVIFQLLHVYPFLLNPLLVCTFILALIYCVLVCVRLQRMTYLFLLLFYAVLFFSQAFLFVKWTRYMVPTLPFAYLMIALFFTSSWVRRQIFAEVIFVITVLLCVIFSTAYFVTAFDRTDTRIAAATWAKQVIPSDASILSEVYDLGIVPFNTSFSHISLFNFYELDNKSAEFTQDSLQAALATSSYIVLPSQRLLKVRMIDEKRFPIGNSFYTELLSGSLGYRKIYESACDWLCLLTYFGSPIYSYEETANVFDRPEVMIFEKL